MPNFCPASRIYPLVSFAPAGWNAILITVGGFSDRAPAGLLCAFENRNMTRMAMKTPAAGRRAARVLNAAIEAKCRGQARHLSIIALRIPLNVSIRVAAAFSRSGAVSSHVRSPRGSETIRGVSEIRKSQHSRRARYSAMQEGQRSRCSRTNCDECAHSSPSTYSAIRLLTQPHLFTVAPTRRLTLATRLSPFEASP